MVQLTATVATPPAAEVPPSVTLSTSYKGRHAETLAADYVAEAGWMILERNFRSPGGEIDLVVSKASILAFVEVKAVDAYGLESLASSVNARKRRRIVETSKLYLARHREYRGSILRYDVIAVRSGRVEAWLEGAFAE